eukprot:4000676-Amphidinium_carterae.2
MLQLPFQHSCLYDQKCQYSIKNVAFRLTAHAASTINGMREWSIYDVLHALNTGGCMLGCTVTWTVGYALKVSSPSCCSVWQRDLVLLLHNTAW